MKAMQPSITSPRLCGGMLVAMPTAMPPAPLTSRFGKRAGRTDGSCLRLVVVGLEVDRVLVDVVEERHRRAWRGGTRCSASPPADRRRRSRNCPARRSSGRRMREILRHAHQGVVDRLVAVRVVLAHHVADDAGRFHVCLVRRVAVLVHRVEDAPVHGLEPVAGVGQRPAHDHAHGVIEVGALHLVGDGDRLDVARRLVARGAAGADDRSDRSRSVFLASARRRGGWAASSSRPAGPRIQWKSGS